MATEWELECAICARPELLLPDLHSDGYRIVRQVILGGSTRRLDLVLSRPGHAWIIELKRGAPPMPQTIAQILDYEQCWKAAFPDIPVNLMVISHSAPESTIRTLAEKRIEYRAISVKKILEVLSHGVSTELLGECTRLETDDEGRVRFLLSNFAHTTVPAGMRFGEPWSHESVFYALIRDGMSHKDAWKKNIYVKIFDHKPNCAILYHPEWDNKEKDRSPLHVNRKAASWPRDGWILRRLLDTGVVELGNVDRGKATAFEHYRILDWNQFAAALNLVDSADGTENTN